MRRPSTPSRCRSARRPSRVQRDDASKSSRASRGTARPSARGRRARSRPRLRRTQAATICCARMSSGRGGIGVRSRTHRRIDARSAAPSTSSSSVSGKSRPFGIFRSACPARPTRCRNVAIERVAPTWIDEVHVADVDAELERGRRDERAQLARLQALLGVEAPRLREAAVVARDRVLAEEARELRRDALGHLARVDEDERRPVLADELRHPRVDLLPLLVRADGRERRRRDLDRRGRAARNVPASTSAQSRPSPTRKRPTSSSGFCVAERPIALDGPAGERLEALEREREVAAPLVAHERVDLVHDDRRDRPQHLRGRRRSSGGDRATRAS